MLGSGWYRQLLLLISGLVVLIALGAGVSGGTAGVLRVGLVVLGLGLLSLAIYVSPWLEQEWPLDGKDSWLVAACVLTTLGLPVTVAGLLL